MEALLSSVPETEAETVKGFLLMQQERIQDLESQVKALQTESSHIWVLRVDKAQRAVRDTFIAKLNNVSKLIKISHIVLFKTEGTFLRHCASPFI
jgi:hypothetical protein